MFRFSAEFLEIENYICFMNYEFIMELLITNWHVVLLFFIVAILYSSVGFGGGSSYLAILALTGVIYTQVRSTALLCNIIVVAGNVLLYQQQKLYDFKKIMPLIFTSIPMAFLGGFLKINQTVFFILLGITLLFAAVTMWISKKIASEKTITIDKDVLKNASYGGFVGFISGMVGIGGGVFLAPLLHLTNWNTPKKIAAIASLFILVNSLAGLLGQVLNPDFALDWNFTALLLGVVFVGGQIGQRISATFFTPILLKKITAILIAFVAIRILFKYLF